MKDIKVVVEKMTRNRRKVIGKPGDSLLCRLHSIQLSSLGILFSMADATMIKKNAHENIVKLPSKVAHNRPNFFSVMPTGPNLNSCSIKNAHRSLIYVIVCL